MLTKIYLRIYFHSFLECIPKYELITKTANEADKKRYKTFSLMLRFLFIKILFTYKKTV